MKQRDLKPERMDDPELPSMLHAEALRSLQRINRWTGNAKIAWAPIWALAKSLQADRLSVLDVATGAGDVPLDLLRLAAKAGLSLDIEACDVSPRAIGFARENAQRQGADLELFQLDVLQQQIKREYDVVMCATFLHHLSDGAAARVLGKMLGAARHQVVVVDLVRSTLNWWQVWLATRTLSRSNVVHFDGPQSVRAAFSLPEIRQIARQAGLRNVEIRTVWPCRFVLTGSRVG